MSGIRYIEWPEAELWCVVLLPDGAWAAEVDGRRIGEYTDVDAAVAAAREASLETLS